MEQVNFDKADSTFVECLISLCDIGVVFSIELPTELWKFNDVQSEHRF